jgi:hypothetical protein
MRLMKDIPGLCSCVLPPDGEWGCGNVAPVIVLGEKNDRYLIQTQLIPWQKELQNTNVYIYIYIFFAETY